MKILNNFLQEQDFNKLVGELAVMRSKEKIDARKVALMFDPVKRKKLISPILEAADSRVGGMENLELTNFLLRFEKTTGLLHHDLNKKEKRKRSIVYYVEEAISGGEIVFPFYNSAGELFDNKVAEVCSELAEKQVYVSKAKDVEEYIIENKELFLTVSPKPNTAILLDNEDETQWHFACPVTEGKRSCFVLFWEGK